VALLLSRLAQRFFAVDGQAFEPLGWLQSNVDSHALRRELTLTFWKDFLQPTETVSDDGKARFEASF
jgi:hypothetical protein